MNRIEFDDLYSKTDEAVTAMSKFLTRWAVKGKGLKHEDKNGIVVMFHQKRVGVLMFMFVTYDNLSVELEFDLNMLRMDGKEYMETITEIIITQLEVGRKEKQKNNTIIVLPQKISIPKLSSRVVH